MLDVVYTQGDYVIMNLYTRLSILCSFIGVGAFGIGVIAAILQGGTLGMCFLAALLFGSVAMAFDSLSTRKQTSTSFRESHFAHGFSASHSH